MSNFNKQSHLLRMGRLSIPNYIYLITSCCHNKQALFINPTPAELLLKQFAFIDAQAGCMSHAYVIMPDHFHWLVQPGKDESLDRLVGRLKANSTRALNKLRGSNSKVWQKSFHDHALRREEQLKMFIEYILNNPVRAGLADTFDKYPFSFAVGTKPLLDQSPL
jgi:putative transposase